MRMKENWGQLVIVSIVIIMVSLFFFIIGVAFGTSITTEDFIATFIPIFSALGGWVSGVGAIAAVFVALRLAEEQSRKDSEQLEIKLTTALVPVISKDFVIYISATSVGLRPSLISSISITGGKNSSFELFFSNFLPYSDELPKKLNYCENASWYLNSDEKKTIANYIDSECNGNFQGLTLNIKTSTRNFTYKPSEDFIELIRSQIKNK